MRYSQLKAFHHVALLGGFSRAADALFLTQPAISEQVRKLEQAHDVLLFTRARKRVQLTEAGQALFRLTRRFFEIEQQIAEFMSETRAVVDGELRIVADSAHHLTECLGRFRARYPNVTVTLRTGNTEEILNELRTYNAELGVVGSLTRARAREMVARDLGTTPIIAFSARGFLPEPGRGLTLDDLGALPLIFRENGSKTRQKLEHEAAHRGIVLRPAIVAEGREAVREIVAAGAGIGFVSRAEFGHDDRLTPIALKGVKIEMRESLVYLAQRRDVRTIRAFMEIARTIPANPARRDAE